jgi:uncharacterized protein
MPALFFAAEGLIIFLICHLFICSAYALEVPQLQGYVNDYAGMISPHVKSKLESDLKEFEKSDTTQIVILTIPSIEGEVLEEFSIKAAEAWKIGQKDKDNGIILVVAQQERKIRIEVGRGLEGKLTDLTAGRIIDIVIKPQFKRGDFDNGFTGGVSALIDATRGEFKSIEQKPAGKRRGLYPLFSYLVFGFVAIVVIGSLSRVLGGIAGAIGLPAIIYSALFPIGITGIIVFAIIGLISGVALPFLFSGGRGHGAFMPGGGIHWGGGFGGFSGGGDFGGFSGGGGGFGGGGASGDW